MRRRTRHFLLAAALTMAVAAPGAATESSRRTLSLIVGASEFTSSDLKPYALKGAAKDAEAMSRMFEGVAGADSHRTVLVGLAATADAVSAALEGIVAEAATGDRVLLYFSAHGSRIPDMGERDEEDGQDEVLLLADAGSWTGSDLPGALTDDALGAAVERLRAHGADVFLVIDSCASGGAARGAAWPGAGIRAARSLPPALLGIPGSAVRAARAGDDRWIEDDMPPGSGRLVVFAAGDTGSAAWDTAAGGVFTRSLVAAAREKPADFAGLARRQQAIQSGFGLPLPRSSMNGAIGAGLFFDAPSYDLLTMALALPAPDWTVSLHAAPQVACDPERSGAPRPLDPSARQTLANCEAVMVAVDGKDLGRVDAWYVDSSNARTLLTPVSGLLMDGRAPARLSFTFIARDPESGEALPSGVDRLVLMRRQSSRDAPDAATVLEFAVNP